ncbi:MAG: NAD-dependent epimerase/dehydratase family protein [Ilumatobacteraceae bacterium]|jgi:UDP-glucose 4-epimerase
MSGRGDVCVCGGAGFVGSHLVDRLVADGRTVDVVDDLSTGSLANLAGARRTPERLRIQHLDAGAPEFAEFLALRAPRVVYHLALLTPAAARTAEMLRAATLLLGTLEAARQVGVGKVVVALPATLWYGEVPARHLPVKEGHRTDPMGVGHVVARTIVELLGVYRERHAVEFTAAVLGNVYGPRQRPEDGVVAAFAAAVADRRDPEIHGTGRQTRDFVWIDDAVDALAACAERGGGLAINVGTGVQTSIADLWALFAPSTTRRPRPAPARPGDVQRLALSPTRARIQLGWSSWTPLAEGVRMLTERDPRSPGG